MRTVTASPGPAQRNNKNKHSVHTKTRYTTRQRSKGVLQVEGRWWDGEVRGDGDTHTHALQARHPPSFATRGSTSNTLASIRSLIFSCSEDRGASSTQSSASTSRWVGKMNSTSAGMDVLLRRDTRTAHSGEPARGVVGCQGQCKGLDVGGLVHTVWNDDGCDWEGGGGVGAWPRDNESRAGITGAEEVGRGK